MVVVNKHCKSAVLIRLKNRFFLDRATSDFSIRFCLRVDPKLVKNFFVGYPDCRDPHYQFSPTGKMEFGPLCGSLCSRVEPVLITLFPRNRYLLRALIRAYFYEKPECRRLVNLHRANKQVNRLLVGGECISNTAFIQEIGCELGRLRTRIRRRVVRLHARAPKRSRAVISGRRRPRVILTCAGLDRSIRERKGRFAVR
jgi:hypothetical protein